MTGVTTRDGALPAEASERPSRGAMATDIAALLGLLGALVAANREWVFNPFRWVDTWMYLGFFRHWDYAPMLADNKKIARLPWIVFGYLVDHLTSPLAAQYILHLGFLAASAIALYVVLSSQFGRAVAVITSAFYLTYLPAHGSGGWDFNNTPSAFLYILAFAALLKMTERLNNPFRAAIVPGLLVATLLISHILYLLLAPALALVIARRVREKLSGPALRHWVKQTLLAGFGCGVVVTILLGLVNLIVGREFIFVEKLVARIGLMIIEPAREKVWWKSWAQRWWYDSHELPLDGYHMPLLLVVVILIAFVVFASYAGGVRVGKLQREAISTFLISLLVFVVLQATGHPLMQPAYMAFPLVIPTFFAVAALTYALLAPVRSTSGWHWNGIATVFTCGAFAVVFITLSATPAPWHFGRLLPYDGRLAVVPIVLAFIVGWLLLRLPRRTSTTWGAAATGLLVLAMSATNAEWPSDPALREGYNFRERCRLREPTFALIIEADRFLFSRASAGNYLPLAYRSGETLQINGCEMPLTEVTRPLASMGYDVVMPYWKMEATPQLPDDVIDQTARERTMVTVITREAAYRDSVLARLRQRVPEWHIEGETSLTLDGKPTGATVTVLSRPVPPRRSGG